MTSATVAIYRLRQIPEVVAMVGQRIYQLKLPEKATLPALRVQLVDDDRTQHLRGGVNLVRGRVQVDVYVQDAGAGWMGTADALADAVHGDELGPQSSGLAGWIGEVGGSPAAAEVLHVGLATRMQSYEPDELRLVRVMQDFYVTWRRLPVT